MGISDVGLAYVLAIFIFTLVIRLLILPFNIKAAKSTRGMQKIQPEVKKLQEKYKDDPQKLNAETMKLYKENNVSHDRWMSSIIITIANINGSLLGIYGYTRNRWSIILMD